MPETIVILGSGCAGLTAAIYAARANLEPLLLEGSQPGGQLTTTSEVENFPGFPEGVDGFLLMDHLRKQAARFGTRFRNALVESAALDGPLHRLHLTGGETVATHALIVATGASPRLLGVPGEQEMYGGKGVTTCATCDGAFYRDEVVAVIGGGDSACEEALFLTRFCEKIYLVHRRDELRASSIMAERALQHEKIEPVWNSVVEEILPDEKGTTRGLRLQDRTTGESSELACRGVFFAIGHIPNTAPFRDQLRMDEAGYLLPEPGSQVRTTRPRVYVAGDCADSVYRQAITAAGMGCQAAIDAERDLGEYFAEAEAAVAGEA